MTWLIDKKGQKKKKKKDKLPQGRQQPVCLTRAGERRNKDGGSVRGRVGQGWETRAAEEGEMSREPWEVSLSRHSGGTVQWTLSPLPPGKKNPPGCGRVSRIFPQTCPMRKTANTPTLARWHRQHSEHRRCRPRKSVINVSPALYFLSDQRWRGSGGLEAKRGIQSAFGCKRKDISEPGRVNVLFVPPHFPVLLSLCRLCWHKLERPSHGSVGGAGIQLWGPKLHKAHLQIFLPWCHTDGML